MSVWVTARGAYTHNCALSGALDTRGFKVMESVVRVLVTTLAFSTSLTLREHYQLIIPHTSMHTHTRTHTHIYTHTQHLPKWWQYTDSVVQRTNENILQVHNLYLRNCACLCVCASLTSAWYLDRWRIGCHSKREITIGVYGLSANWICSGMFRNGKRKLFSFFVLGLLCYCPIK